MSTAVLIQRCSNGIIVSPFNGSTQVDLSAVSVFPQEFGAYSPEARQLLAHLERHLMLPMTPTAKEIATELAQVSKDMSVEELEPSPMEPSRQGED